MSEKVFQEIGEREQVTQGALWMGQMAGTWKLSMCLSRVSYVPGPGDIQGGSCRGKREWQVKQNS